MEKFFEELLKIVQSGSAFIQGQMPDFVNQLLVYNFWSNIIITLVLFLMATGFFGIAFFYYVTHKTDSFIFITSVTFGIAVLLAFLIIAPMAINDCIKIKVAPKVYIIDYLTNKIGTIK
jgi:hypothetical protein